jgi:hypothetical protein
MRYQASYCISRRWRLIGVLGPGSSIVMSHRSFRSGQPNAKVPYKSYCIQTRIGQVVPQRFWCGFRVFLVEYPFPGRVATKTLADAPKSLS